MPNLNDLLRNPQAETLMGNREQLGHLMDAPETQKLFAMLNKNTGGGLDQAAEKAAKGDTAQLMDAIRQLMQDPNAAPLIQQMKAKLKP